MPENLTIFKLWDAGALILATLLLIGGFFIKWWLPLVTFPLASMISGYFMGRSGLNSWNILTFIALPLAIISAVIMCVLLILISQTEY